MDEMLLLSGCTEVLVLLSKQLEKVLTAFHIFGLDPIYSFNRYFLILISNAIHLFYQK